MQTSLSSALKMLEVASDTSGATSVWHSIHITIVAVSAVLMLVYWYRCHRLPQQWRREKDHYVHLVLNQDQEIAALRDRMKKTLLLIEQFGVQQTEGINQRALLEQEIHKIQISNPRTQRIIYNVGVIGMNGSGKTALIKKLTDPCFEDFAILQCSSRYPQWEERTVVTQYDSRSYTRTEHVLRFIEWAGEFLIEAQSDMLNMCRPDYYSESGGTIVNAGIQALVLVVDLAWLAGDSPADAAPRNQVFSKARIQQQNSEYFSPDAMNFLLNERILHYLQRVVVFINKADCMEGRYHEIEDRAQQYFAELISVIQNRTPNVDVVVGSASTDLGLHRLVSSLATQILPQKAWSPDEPIERGSAPRYCPPN